jgi:hypothetical protein
MRIISKRGIAAAVAAAGMCIAVPVGSASASGGVLNASSGDEAHQCTVLDNYTDYDGNQAVVCATLQTNINAGYPTVGASEDVLCQNVHRVPVQQVRCAEVHEYGAIANAATGAGRRYEFDCGHSWGLCPAGRQTTQMGSYVFPGEGLDTCPFGYANNVWAVVYGQGALTSVELPGSDIWVYLDSSAANDSGNESSGHYYICP